MIPQEKNEAVTRGLQAAFGVSTFDDINTIKDLASSLVFRIVVRGSPFLLKISSRTNDPGRHYGCMEAAAEAGLAPHVWYCSAPDRISITDFVNAAPFPVTDALIRLPATLRKLHALAPFPGVPNRINTSCTFLLNNGAALEGVLQKARTADILSKAEIEELFGLHAQLTAAYPQNDTDMVSSHNDLFKPDNILFDGQRVWLVDWEAAFLNDRYADLAVVANMVAGNEAEERIFLREYFGRSPDDYELARLFLMRQLAHIFYTIAYLFFGSPDRRVNFSEPVPEFRELQQRIWAGEADLSNEQIKISYGRAHLERLLQNAGQARFDEALRIVSDRHAGAPV